MQKISFENLPSTNTPLNASNLNTLQNNVEDAIDSLISNTYGTSQTKGYSQEYINGLHTPTITTIDGINYIKYGHIVFMSGMLTANVASGNITLAYKPKWDCGFAITGFYPQSGNTQAFGYVYMSTNNLTASYKASAAFTVAPISTIYYTDD